MFIISATSREEMVQLVKEVIKELQADQPNAKPAKDNSDELLTLKQTAALLDVSRATIFLWRKQGQLTAVKKGSKTYFFKKDILSSFKSNSNRKRHVNKIEFNSKSVLPSSEFF